ncbi:MAG: exo-alpha-sialidase, partial [bacterium]|nr:exo-alpha-sialidase [bacterium]
MKQELTTIQKTCLTNVLSALINQENARVLIPANEQSSGFWFGGGNLVQDRDGSIWIGGRYRNHGDSRTGLKAGQRGLECAIFRSDDSGQTFTKIHSWSKADLSYPERKVLSIEGTALHQCDDGSWEFFISTEKEMPYPELLRSFQKPGTGVWTIDRINGSSLETFDLSTLTPVLENAERPEYLHVKDPVVFDAPNGDTALIFCTHPFTWASGNSGLALRKKGQEDFQLHSWEVVSRGAAWDVASTRLTGRLPIPRLGCFADLPPCAIYFYDGVECVRSHEENVRAHKRPRGYSCEEISGAFFGWDETFPQMERVSQLEPLFISPWGTGCSRYTETLVTDDGILAAWQQSQKDFSQPLVGHFLPMDDVRRI